MWGRSCSAGFLLSLLSPSPARSEFASQQPQPLSVTQIPTPTLAMSEIVSQLPPLMENLPPPIRVRISSGVSLGPFAKGVQLGREQRALDSLTQAEERHSCPTEHTGDRGHSPSHCSPCQHGVQQDPQAPDVTALVVALPLQDLGTTKKKGFGSSLISEEGLDLGAVHVQSFQSWTEQQSVGLKDQDSKQIHHYQWDFCNCLSQGGLEVGTRQPHSARWEHRLGRDRGTAGGSQVSKELTSGATKFAV